jgi:hypothetical protein
MWDLNGKQAKEFTIKYLNDFMEKEGFNLKKTQNTSVHYIRKTKIGFDALYLSYIDSFPGKEINCMLEKRIDKVEYILAEIQKAIDLNYIIDKSSTTFATNYAKVNGIKHNRYMPKMENEIDVKNSCELLIQFLENIGLLYLDRFEDIKELDNEINGVNYWTDDILMPFDTRGYFAQKRMIIARLANQGNFDKVMQKSYESMDKWLIENNQPLIDRKDITKGTPFIEYYLRNLKV